MRAVWQTLAQRRDLRLVLGAGLVSLTGDWVLRVGLAYHIYVLTGSTLASATMLLASFLPQVLLGSLAGVFVDRWDRKHTMIVANLLLAAGLAPLLLVHSVDRVWVVYVVLLWEGCVQQFFAPAEEALLPSLVPDDRLVTANALVGQTRDVSRLIGSAVGGVAVATGGMPLLTCVDAGSFVLSAVMISLVRTPGRVSAVTAAAVVRAESVRHRLGALRREWADGLRLSTHHQVLRVIMIFLLVTCVGEGIMSTLFAPFVRSTLAGSGQEYGLIVSVQAVGGIVGGLLAASVGEWV
ncbi:MAG: MFS transporter, partial [Nocardioidaceae bacterium]